MEKKSILVFEADSTIAKDVKANHKVLSKLGYFFVDIVNGRARILQEGVYSIELPAPYKILKEDEFEALTEEVVKPVESIEKYKNEIDRLNKLISEKDKEIAELSEGNKNSNPVKKRLKKEQVEETKEDPLG